MTRAILPKKEDIARVVGSDVAKDPQVDAFTDKELIMSATVDPTTCTDAYALLWAFTAPKDTTQMTSANYAVGNSALVISVGNAPDDLASLKKLVDSCPSFTVSRTANAAKYTVGDTLTQYATEARLISPTQLLIATGTSSQVLTSTEDSCTATGSLSPSCIQTQSDRVFQDIRRVGPNLVSVWGVSSTELGGSPTADPQISQQAVTAVADAMQFAVESNSSAAPSSK